MINISQLTKRYGDNPVLRGIEFKVSAGETDCCSDHGGYRKRSHVLADDPGFGQPQKILAASGMHQAKGSRC